MRIKQYRIRERKERKEKKMNGMMDKGRRKDKVTKHKRNKRT